VGQIAYLGFEYSHADREDSVRRRESIMIAGKPSVLVVDDDPVSLAFLAGAIDRCGCTALTAADAHSALDALPTKEVHLMLIDRNLPDAEGSDLLRRLRARGVEAPAVATSAELDPATVTGLVAAGFADTLSKPATFDSIEGLLRRFVGAGANPAEGRSPAAAADVHALLDDAAALSAIGGDRGALRALRGLFATELRTLAEALQSDAGPAAVPTLTDTLHRLRASCGFCGAPLLAAAALNLERCLRDGADTHAAVSAFTRVCAETALALAADTQELVP
jgi:CheY-like chemotaxis protein